MTRLSVKTLDLAPGDILIPRPNTADCEGDTVEAVVYPPHSQLTNAAMIRYVRNGQKKQFLAGIEVEHKVERP